VAQILADLLARPVDPQEVRDRSIAFGLLRQAGSGEGTELTAQNASRLLLAVYRLPAQMETATWPEVCRHHSEGRRVFLMLANPVNPRPPAVGLPAALAVDGLPADDTRTNGEAAPCLPAEQVIEAWSHAGHLAVIAARRWADLPADGMTFFAGSRSREDIFYWNTAECDTDRDGNIVWY
jgi:hypothetical protein